MEQNSGGAVSIENCTGVHLVQHIRFLKKTSMPEFSIERFRGDPEAYPIIHPWALAELIEDLISVFEWAGRVEGNPVKSMAVMVFLREYMQDAIRHGFSKVCTLNILIC